MAYGSDELDVAATTVDQWMNEGDNGIDLMAHQDPFFAIVYDNSLEPGGEWQFQEGTPGEGNQWKWTVYGKGPGTSRGVSRSAQTTGYSPSIHSIATNVQWTWSHYEGISYVNYEDKTKNSGKSRMVNLMELIRNSLVSETFALYGYHLWDQQAGADRRLQSITGCLLNTGTVGGIDTTDTTNNWWWAANHNSDTEALNPKMFQALINSCQHDSAIQNGIRKNYADIAFVPEDHYAQIQEYWLRPSQRQEVNELARGGSRYIVFGGVRIFRNGKFRTSAYGTDDGNTVTVSYPMTFGSATDRGVILNSTTWGIRYATKMPEPVTEGYIPVSGKPSMWERGHNHILGVGTKSLKHNSMYSNKS